MSSLLEEPLTKKPRITSESTSAVRFYDSSSPHDRVVIVKNQRFYVDSNVVSCSKFLRKRFAKRNEVEIPFEDVTVDKFREFLMIATNPASFLVNDISLDSLCPTLRLLKAFPLLMKVLEANDSFNKIPKEDLLNLARKYHINSLTNILEGLFLRQVTSSSNEDKMKLLQIAREFDLKKLLARLPASIGEAHEGPKIPIKRKVDDVSPDTLKFCKRNSPRDRVVIVRKQKFFVDSNALGCYSKFFRKQFAKRELRNEVEIPWKTISLKDFNNFVMAATYPENFEPNEDSLDSLIGTVKYLAAIPLLMKILDVSDNFNKLSKEVLLRLSHSHNVLELENKIEKILVEEFENGTGKEKTKLYKYGIEFDLVKLLDSAEKLFFALRSYESCDNMLSDYRNRSEEFLQKRIKNIERVLMQRLEDYSNSDDFLRCEKFDVAQYGTFANTYKLIGLKALVCSVLIEYLEKQKSDDGLIDDSKFEEALAVPNMVEYKELEAYLSDHLKFELESENIINRIEYAVKHQLPTFKRYLIKKFAQIGPTDPFSTENKEEVSRLSRGAQDFISKAMSNNPIV